MIDVDEVAAAAEQTAVDEAAARAERGESALPPMLGLAPPGLGEVQGNINVTGVRDARGLNWVRIVWGSPGHLAVIDLPTAGSGAQNVAADVGRAILQAATKIEIAR